MQHLTSGSHVVYAMLKQISARVFTKENLLALLIGVALYLIIMWGTIQTQPPFVYAGF